MMKPKQHLEFVKVDLNSGWEVPPGYPPGLPPLPLPESGGAVGGDGLVEPVGRPVMTSGTPGSTPLDPMYATKRTTWLRCSGSQAMSVRSEKLPSS